VSHTLSPVALVTQLEANGPRACLTRRAWHVLAVLMRAVDPGTADVEISHQDIAHRAGYLSTKSVQRGLAELVDVGLVDHVPGGRVGHGTTDVRISYVRVWLEVVETLLDEGREMIRRARQEAWSMTQARMRQLLDWRARKRARGRAVDNLAGLLDVALDERKPRSAVMDRLSTSPPGPRPPGVGVRAPDPYIRPTCPHDGEIGRCPTCRKEQTNGTGFAGAQTTRGGA
jgi:hypothetical protein